MPLAERKAAWLRLEQGMIYCHECQAYVPDEYAGFGGGRHRLSIVIEEVANGSETFGMFQRKTLAKFLSAACGKDSS